MFLSAATLAGLFESIAAKTEMKCVQG